MKHHKRKPRADLQMPIVKAFHAAKPMVVDALSAAKPMVVNALRSAGSNGPTAGGWRIGQSSLTMIILGVLGFFGAHILNDLFDGQRTTDQVLSEHTIALKDLSNRIGSGIDTINSHLTDITNGQEKQIDKIESQNASLDARLRYLETHHR